MAAVGRIGRRYVRMGSTRGGGNNNHTNSQRALPFDALGNSLGAPLTGQRSVIDALGPTSFTVNGVRVSGSVLLMPTYATLWNVEYASDCVPEALTLVKLSRPIPDVVVFGTGVGAVKLPQDTLRFLSRLGVGVEILDTKNACHTFNVLNQEARNVAAALLPMGVARGPGIA